MKATNSITTAERPKFSAVITGNTMQSLILTSLGGDKASAKRLTSTLISAVSANQQLRACQPASIVAAALRGEGMGLIFGHGYYAVPYGDVCKFILGYKGMIALCLATGRYADIDCVDVREGEYKGRNARTGKPNIDLSVYGTDEERDKHPIIGYKAYFELKDGFYKEEYWPMGKLLAHADRYSKGFSLSKYKDLEDGNLTPAEANKLMNNSSPWYDINGGQDLMCRKTVLRSLLNSGYAPMSNEVATILRNDEDDGIVPEMPQADNVFEVNNETGEVVGYPNGYEAEENNEPAQEEAAPPTEDTPADKKPRRGQKKAVSDDAETETVHAEGEQSNFFDL